MATLLRCKMVGDTSGKAVWNMVCTASFQASATTKASDVVKNMAERAQKVGMRCLSGSIKM